MHPPSIPVSALAAAAVLVLAGCATPYTESQVVADRVASMPVTRPGVIMSPVDPLLRCVGDKLQQASLQRLVLGQVLEDSTGKTGVDVGMLGNGALHKIASRAQSLAISPLGMGTKANEAQIQQATNLTLLGRADPAALLFPDWVVAGGVSSVSNAVRSKQNSFGVGGTDVDLGGSNSTSVDVANLHLTLRHFGTQAEFPGASISLTVSAQQMSSAVDGGVFVAASVNGKRTGAGVRLGRTTSRSHVMEDALRVGFEYGTAFLLAQQLNIDLSICPVPGEAANPELPAGGVASSVTQLPAQFDRMSPAARQEWARGELRYLGYLGRGQAGGGNGWGDDLRSAIGRYQAREGIPPTGELDPSTFYRLAQGRISRGEPLLATPSGAAPGLGRLIVQTSSPVTDYEAPAYLRASVVAPTPGHLYCLLQHPQGVLPVYPMVSGRSSFVNGRAPVLLPDNNDRGRHPSVVLDAAGAHALWCTLTSLDVTSQLPATLRPGSDGSGWPSLESARQRVLAVAGEALLAQGGTAFNVQPAPPQADAAPAPAPAEAAPAAAAAAAAAPTGKQPAAAQARPPAPAADAAPPATRPTARVRAQG